MRNTTVDDAGPAAVLVGLDCITGLQSARILARHGVPVIGLAADTGHYCCRTRAAARLLQADTASEAVVEALARLGPSLKHRAVLYPCNDASVLQLARHRERVAPWFDVALPERRVVETLMDKTRFSAFAGAVGLPIPRTMLLRERADAERAARELVFPCVLKPSVKTSRWLQHTAAKVFRADTPGQLLQRYGRCSAWTDDLMVQEWVEGPDSELYSCNCYYDRAGRALVTFVARKLRQWPPRTGTSCLGEECRNDTVLELTRRTFDAAGFHGLGYLEVKRDVRTGVHYVIEANVGRPTGRSAIAEAGGVELIYAMYCDMVGLPLPAQLAQRYGGAKWIFWRQDVRSAFYYWRNGELTLTDWARSLKGCRTDAVFSWSDPAPFLMDLAQGLGLKPRPRRSRNPAPGKPGGVPTAEPAEGPTQEALEGMTGGT